MKWIQWMRPGLQVKRWALVGFSGIILMALSFTVLMRDFKWSFTNGTALLVGVAGVTLTIFGFYKVMASIMNIFSTSISIQGRGTPLKPNLVHDIKLRARGPKVVVIGGGTGLSVLLRGLKLFTSNITAIVTVADDGGGSGKLREDLGMLPPGDIRNCILALAEMEPTMEKLLQYRFEEGSLKGQSFGNLFIASMNGISNNFEDAVKSMSEVLAVRGQVLPVTLENVTLYAKLENGRIIKGESNIPYKSLEDKSPIERVFIKPKESEAVGDAVEAILNADIVVLGPGSLYTSIIPNLLIKNIRNSLLNTEAIKVYIPNVMTQPGETDGYGAYKHVEALYNHCSGLSLDYVIVNTGDIPKEVREKYLLEGAKLIGFSEEDGNSLKSKDIDIIQDNLIEIKKDYVRHDAIKLSKIIVRLVKG
ncbi:gluconeogenesis factor YvcK family protein [Alkaliphilus serpentinus]|uniref:Putative gluconeogenesis factor n=1 Tax=Alkaliphilus serpentinus TaxID=1482731 RepID=A0A833HRL0_9FIRM|nr:YvcK family protein [Alkaliphilus serpentinus]KAB3533517.1 YvcK family protein [Alkaliphilus serpentinus]